MVFFFFFCGDGSLIMRANPSLFSIFLLFFYFFLGDRMTWHFLTWQKCNFFKLLEK